MPMAQDIRGTVYKNGTAVLMARIVGPDGEPVETADIDSLSYTVYEIDPVRPDSPSAIAGHTSVALDEEQVFFDELQTGELWTLDEEGFNFRHEVDVSTNPAFPKADVNYQVRYEITPIGGQKMVFRFLLHSI